MVAYIIEQGTNYIIHTKISTVTKFIGTPKEP